MNRKDSWYVSTIVLWILVVTFGIISLFAYDNYYKNTNFSCLSDPEESDNWAMKLSQLHLDIIQSTSGFISPPLVSRALAMVNGAMYTSLTPYIERLKPVYDECNHVKNIVIYGTPCSNADNLKYAMLVAVKEMVNIIYAPRPTELAVFNSEINQLFLEFSGDYSVANDIGIISADCMNERSKNDGSNQLGNEPGTNNSVIYSDYTNYRQVNPPQDTPGITTCSKLESLNHWQQLKIPLEGGGFTIREFLSPHMGRVKPFALNNAYEFLPPAPPQLYTNTHTDQLEEVAEVVEYSGLLTDQLKVIAEYWADGPKTTQPPGHWQEISIEMAKKYKLNLVDTVLVLFLQANAIFDGGISAWAAKRYYDLSRPITQIQCIYANQMIQAWKGPYMGVGMINGSTWQPYQSTYFVTPPFAEYVSGHSTFSRASAVVLKLFFGSDKMGLSYTVKEGESIFEPKIEAGNPGYVAGVTDVPNTGPETVGYVPATDIELSWATFTEASNESGLSRLYGGIHFQSGNMEGLKLGERVGEKVYERFKSLTGHEPNYPELN